MLAGGEKHKFLFRGQVSFDFILSLGALALLFIALFGITSFHNTQSIVAAERLAMERTCEALSSKLVAARVNGDGYEGTFYTRIPVSFNGTREVYLGESYLCIVPETYITTLSEPYDGEFIIKNRNNALFIERQV